VRRRPHNARGRWLRRLTAPCSQLGGVVLAIGPAPPLHCLCTAPALLLHCRLQRTPGLGVEIPEEPPPGTPAGGNARLTFRKVVRGVTASMELNVAHSMLPAMRFIGSERPSFYASELPGVDE